MFGDGEGKLKGRETEDPVRNKREKKEREEGKKTKTITQMAGHRRKRS